MNAKGYSLWLIPEREIFDKFTMLIKKLASEYGGPVFIPHITMLGEITHSEEEVIKLTEKLVSSHKPFSVALQKIDYQDYFFRALFILVEKTSPLLTLHEQAKILFNMQDTPPYMPHLNLLYGNYSLAVKERIIEVIGRDQTAQFTVNSIFIYKTEGEADTWYKVRELPF